MTIKHAILALLMSLCINATLGQCADIQACNFSSDEPCFYPGSPCDDFNSLTVNDTYNADCNCESSNEIILELFDDGGNGFSGTSITITSSSDGVTYGPFSLASGTSSVESLNLPVGCYEIAATEDAQNDESYYLLSSPSGSIGNSLLGIPGDTQTFGVGVISGCTDPTAVNYEPNATCDSGDCYVCGIDGDCEVGMDGFLKPALCNTIDICGPGFYIIVGLGSGSIFSEACITKTIPNKLGDYEIRLLPLGGTMELVYENIKPVAEPRCFYVDENGCNSYEFDWKRPKKGILQMQDDCGLGWEGISYQICDSQFNPLETGSLNQAEFGGTFSLGYDAFDLEDGCYILKFLAEDCFYPCQEFSLFNAEEGTIQGIVEEEFIPFSINVGPCTYGCTDLNALNYDIDATNACFGDNSCCDYTPINNDCDNAIVLTANDEILWNTEFSTPSDFSCTGNPAQDLWYSFTANCNMIFSLDAFSTNNSIITVYEESCPIQDGEEISCPVIPYSNLASTSINGEIGKTYFVQLSADNNLSPFGKGSLKLSEIGCSGCTDLNSSNYDPLASIEDGSCISTFCAGDFDGDGFVNVSDLGGFLGAFGSSCFPPMD